MKYRILFILLLLVCLVNSSTAQHAGKGNFMAGSVLSSGAWYKIATVEDGVYKLSYADLIQLGVSGPISSSEFRLYGNGGALVPEKIAASRYDDLVENPVMVYDGGDGSIDNGDYILFYGQGTTRWNYNPLTGTFGHQVHYYSDTAYYFITFDLGTGQRIQPFPQIDSLPDLIVNTYNEHLYHENDSLNLLRSGKRWYGEVFNDLTTKSFGFSLPDISLSDSVFAVVNMAVRSVQKSAVVSNLNGIAASVDTILPVDGNVNSDYAKTATIRLGSLPQSDTVILGLSYSMPETNSAAWLDNIEIFGYRNLIYRGKQLRFRNVKTMGQPISRFDITTMASTPRVWNIRDFTSVREMPLDINGATVSFKSTTDSLGEFVAFDDDNTLQPFLIGSIPNQNLHGSEQAEFLVVTHPDFYIEANTIADFHRNTDGMSVVVATTTQIFNEFSSGKQDPSAIRDFIRMFYERGKTDSLHHLKYVLLFGDGSYDMKSRLIVNSNYVPTWQTLNSLVPTSSYVSDDFYAMLDSLEGDNLNGNLDIGVGRFPVSNAEEAAVLVEKSLRYGSREDLLTDSYETGQVSNYDPWRNSVSFIADDEDLNLHLKQAEKLVTLVDSMTKNINVKKIYLDAYKQKNTPFGSRYPDVNDEVKRQIQKGTLMVNYTGHGGESGLAGEEVITMADIEQYENYYCLPIFITATCEFSRYDNPAYVSAGEKLLFNKKGGSIALFSTTRVAYAHSNEVVNRNFLKTAFTPINGEKVRFGDMIKKAKNLCSLGVYMQNFTLLGDPALAFAIPEYKVVTDYIGVDTALSFNDTIFNNNIVTVKGRIVDESGNLQSDFNGKIYPVVYDKPVLCNTLVNDPGVSNYTTFYSQHNILYKGNVTVSDGMFEFSFFVSKDLSFSEGFGKISYYAKNKYHDATGVLDSLNLYNEGDIDNSDITGPEIKGYMEDLSFTDGGNTSSEPLMLLYLKDTSGINGYGLGIGHDITAVLDDDFNNPVCLNDYFVQDADKYTSGHISYKFGTLSYGMHKLTISAFDLLNNSNETEIMFNVLTPTDLSFGKVFNYPDPFTDYTNFYIEHNMGQEDMQLKISVFEITGRLATELEYRIPGGYYKPLEIRWNACNAGGVPLSKGFYTYKVTLTDKDGRQKSCSEKLIILK